jgi:hypothetical protein
MPLPRNSYTLSAAQIPATDYQPVTPDNDADLPDGLCRSLLISVGGRLVVHNEAGEVRDLPAVPAGVFPGYVLRVLETTTATGITALY